MKIVFGKKKVPLPNIQISDYVPYTIVPLGVDNRIYLLPIRINLKNASYKKSETCFRVFR